jgi:hypothetical protein
MAGSILCMQFVSGLRMTLIFVPHFTPVLCQSCSEKDAKSDHATIVISTAGLKEMRDPPSVGNYRGS